MDLIELSEKFPDEIDAIRYFERVRWDEKPECPYCGSNKLFNRSSDMRFLCKKCKNSFSVTVNTQLHNTRLPLKTWLFAFSLVSDAKKGISARQLQRNLHVSYPTAWAMGHKIRELMIIENEEIKLEGIIEMDETFVAGKPRKRGNMDYPKRRHSDLDEQITELGEKGYNFTRTRKKRTNPEKGKGRVELKVAGMVQRNGDVIAEVVPTIKHAELKKLVEKYVEENESVLVTDAYVGYKSMNKIIDHIAIDHQTMYSYRGVNTNSIESFWAIVKRGIMGQYHKVSARHLPNYIAEFVFKYNNRVEDDMFDTLVCNAMTPIT